MKKIMLKKTAFTGAEILTRAQLKNVLGGGITFDDCTTDCRCKPGRVASNGTGNFTVTAGCATGEGCSTTPYVSANCANGMEARCADFESSQCHNPE